MSDDRWERLKRVFQGAIEQPIGERRQWLAREAGGDESVRREAEALLAAHEASSEFLTRSPDVDPVDLDTWLPGTVVGQYAIVKELGRGGMGVVYLAEDTRLRRRVALKVLHASLATNPEARSRLHHEARAAATISHPAVATVFALEEIDGHLVIVSEYVPGETLRSLMSRAIDEHRAARFAIQIASALVAAHEANVIHRDLKPENVLVTTKGDIKVVDFGIARVEGPGATNLTRAGDVLGTPAYMAPEQLLGTSVDGRADIYAFGVLLSEVLTGQHPLGSSAPPGPTPRAFATVCARCMQTDPAARYGSARELLAVLEHVDGGSTDKRDLAKARWWWEFHQGATSLAYGLMTIPAWGAQALIGQRWGRPLFLVLLAAVVVAGTLRLHRWFTSRFYPAQLDWVRTRIARWILVADGVLAGTLVSEGLLIAGGDAGLAALLIAVGVGAAIAFLVIEPATTRAAFGDSGSRRA